MPSALDPHRETVRRIMAERVLDEALAQRRAQRPERIKRARKGAATKIHDAWRRDRLLNEQVPL